MRTIHHCPSCGFINPGDEERCLKCGARLTTVDLTDLLSRRRTLLDRLKDGLERLAAPLRRHGGAAERALFRESHPTGRFRPPWVAAMLALFPGGGCLYNRRPLRAAVFASIYLALAAIAVLTLRWDYSNWVLGAWVLWILFCYNDALVLAIRSNGQLWTPRHSLAAYSYLLFAVGCLSLLGQFFLLPVFKLVWIRDEVLEPALARRDRVLVWCASYWFRPPKRGEIVFYDPPAYSLRVLKSPETAEKNQKLMNRPLVHKYEMLMELEDTVYIINESRSFGRVSGLPGDVIERTDGGPLLLNGAPMPPEYYPLVPDGVPPTFHIKVPPDTWCVLISHFSKESFMQIGISFGGTSPSPGSPDVRTENWEKACLVNKEIIGHVKAVYQPPRHRRFFPRPSE